MLRTPGDMITWSAVILRFGLAAALLAAACGGDEGAGAPDGDGGPGDPDSGGDGPGDPAVLFDESVERTYELELAPEDWTWLKENATREEYRPATLRLGDEVVAQASLRFKGSYGSLYFCFDG